jgi:hypothetical protein
MAIHDARHRQGFLPPLEGDLLDKAAHVASSDGIRETVTQLGFDVLPENPVELLRAPFFTLDLLRQINLVELSDRPDALRSLPLRAWLSGDVLALLNIDQKVSRLPPSIGKSEARAMSADRDIQPFALNALAQDVRLDAACTHPKPEPGHDAISKLNLPAGRSLQACNPSIRQTNFVRHMYLLP